MEVLMNKYCLIIRYKKSNKQFVKDCLIYDSLEDLKSDLNDFKKLTDIVSFKTFILTDFDIETGEIKL